MKQLDVDEYVALVGRQARVTPRGAARAGTAQKNRALLYIAAAVCRDAARLKEISARDVGCVRANGHGATFIDRLTLADRAINTMAAGLEQIAALPDPIGEISSMKFHPIGIQVGQMRVPLGMIGIIYESRPSMVVDVATPCIKPGNATILRGGSEVIESNGALAMFIEEGLAETGLPASAVQVAATTDCVAVGKLITMTEYVDTIVSRSGKSLIVRLTEKARAPMIKHLDGICHVYIDTDADTEKAVRVCGNAKTQCYVPCNTMETLLVLRDVAVCVPPPLARIYQDKGVEFQVCPATRAMLEAAGLGNLKDAVEADRHTEYLAPILSIHTVDGLDAAVEHINTCGSAHTDSIITENYSAGMRFLRGVDSASVMINVSTRFVSDFECDLSAETGTSNDKLRVRSPVGLEGPTSLKYVVFGHGEIHT